MPALLMTAAEIAAAEAAAIAAAEAAAIQAAQVAAAEAAAAAAAEAAAAQAATQAATQAGTQAAAQAGTQAATQASTSGIQALAQEVGANTATTGIQTLTPASELEQMRQAASGAQNLAQQPVNFLNNSFAGPVEPIANAANFPGSATNPLSTLTPNNVPLSQGVPLAEVAPSVAPAEAAAVAPTEAAAASAPPQSTSTLYGSGQAPTGTVGPNTYPDITAQAARGSSLENQLLRGELDGTKKAYGEFYDNQYNPLPPPTPPATGLQGLLDKGIAYAKDNPISTGLGAMSLYNMLNRPEPYKKPKYQSTFNASTYRGYEPTPPTPYTPQYAQYAQGGWAEVAPAVMKELKKTGLFKDKSSFDPSKYVASNVEPPTPYKPQYAQGGISDLGGYSDYARGGRMLKGPGDGMSDDIPAIIANKQPAKLANDEFVVPADVVSHLGNGSSEAGAKALYKMMDRVRQARTGTKKQGKQINPEKYLA